MTTASTPTPVAAPAPSGRPAAAFGVVFDGADALDLSGWPSDAVIAMLRHAVDHQHVVIVRGQQLSAADHERLARRFGALVAAPVQQLRGVAPTVSTIEDTPARPPAEFDWHTDLSWTTSPPSYGFLHGVTIPATGGDTMWVDTAALYDALTDDERRWADNATARHAPDPSLLASIERHHGPAMAERLRQEFAGADHPLVGRHPRTGRRALYLSPLYVRAVSGPPGLDGEALLARLHAAFDDPVHQLRWRWRPGDFVIWDERQTVHRALGDHYPQRRAVRRCATTDNPQ